MREKRAAEGESPLSASDAPEGSSQLRSTRRSPVAMWSVPFVLLGMAAAAMFALAIWLDVLRSNEVRFDGLLRTFLDQDLEQARNTLGGLGEVMAAVLGLALTVSSIIVQLAATRFTPHVTSLFFRSRTNLAVLGFFVVCNIYVLWVNFSVGAAFLPHWGVLLAMVLLTASLLLLFPYFAFVFGFLEPDAIITHITTDGLRVAAPLRGRMAANIRERQQRATMAVELLANIGLNAVQQKDKNIASGAVNALCRFGISYGETKAALTTKWHAIPDWLREGPDFVSLSDDAVADIRLRGTWLEWKILRQYQMLFAEGLTNIKDLCYLVAINTRRFGEAAARRGDLSALDLSVKFFNTYLRATLNASDIRTSYNILHQYRQLGESVLSAHDDRTDEAADALHKRGLEIGRFMRYYSGIAVQKRLGFLTEVIAHDIGSLCAVAFHRRCRYHDDLLATFLAVDDTAEAQGAQRELAPRGVRRAQVKLATTYLLHHAEELAQKIREDMATEPASRLRSIWDELASLESREIWEVNDRGTNLDWLSPDQKAKLPQFFGWFPSLNPPAGGRDAHESTVI